MSAPQLEELWLYGNAAGKFIRVDFDNDRHHMVAIHPPHSVDKVVDALERLTKQLRADPLLASI